MCTYRNHEAISDRQGGYRLSQSNHSYVEPYSKGLPIII